MSENNGRLLVHRDWLGHGIQLGAIFVGLGVPLMVWGVMVNVSLGKIEDRAIRQDRDTAEVRAFQSQVNAQMSEVGKTLATLAERVSAIREGMERKRR